MRGKIILTVLLALLVLSVAACRGFGGKTDETIRTDEEEIGVSTEAAAPSDAADEPTQMPEPEPEAPLMTFPAGESFDGGVQDQCPGETEASMPSVPDPVDGTQPFIGSGDENELPPIPF